MFVSEASVIMLNGFVKSGKIRTGALDNACLRWLKAVVHSFVQVKVEYLEVRAVNGRASLEHCGMNLL